MSSASSQKNEVRELLHSMKRAGESSPSAGVSIIMAKVVSLDPPGCSIIESGDTDAIPEVRWLLDAYTPVVGDMVVVLKHATTRVILGRTTNLR